MSTENKARVWKGVVREFTPPGTPACEGVHDVPYLEPGRVTNADALAFQDEYCMACPIFVQCARHAMSNEPYGTWGLTENQRASLGGVVAPEWANKRLDPTGAVLELEDAGVPLRTIGEIVSAADSHNQDALRALRARQRQVAARASSTTAVAA